ncbi:MAG: YicC/YloC family endoribonuclease [Oceanicaulis sp.]
MSAPLSGMTGFGRADRAGEFGRIEVEARSVNGKGLDVRLRLAAGLEAIEPALREMIKARFSRGSVNIAVSYSAPEGAAGVVIDEDRLKAYAEAAKRLSDAGLAAPASAGELMALKGVIASEDAEALVEPETLAAAALEAAGEALGGLQQAREDEGAALAGVLEEHLAEIESLREEAAASAAALPEAIRDRVKAKFDELLPSSLDPDRLAQEAAAIAVKADVREELDRLKAHIDSARQLLAGGSPVGRKLDFLSQEFNREANTLCSKAADPALTRAGLAMKAAVDRLREQVQNVE